jgi:Cysteine-rich secretory protein family
MKMGFRLLVLVGALSCVFAAGGGSDVRRSPGPQNKDFLTPARIEGAIVEALNGERERNGRPALRSLPALADIARAHSQMMAAAQRLFHASELEKPLHERLVAAGLFFGKSGENVARSDSFLPGLIHQALLESPAHRENMLDPDFDAVGIGVVSVDDRAYYVSEVFLQSIPAVGREEAAAELKRKVNEIRRAAGAPPLAFWEEADRFAETMLLARIKGDPAPGPSARFGGFKGFFSESPRLGFEEKAASEVANPRYTHAGLAVEFRRTTANPGGAYLLVLLLMSRDQLDRSPEELGRAVLESINAERGRLGIPGIELSPALMDEARRAPSVLSRETGRGRLASLPAYGHRIMTYLTFDPSSLPAEISSQVFRAEVRSIGIRAVFRRTEEYPMGVILVVLVIRA